MMSKINREQIRTEIGARVAAARKVAGLTQYQIAEAIGIPQRTVSFYERGEGDLPSSLLVSLAEILDIDIRDLLGVDISEPVRRGPRSVVEQRAEAVRTLPPRDQKFVLKFLDQVLEDHTRRRKKGHKLAAE